MNHATPQWSPMVTGPDDDFSSFLDFGDLNFAAFDAIPQDETELQQPDGLGAMDTSMEGDADTLRLEHGSTQQQQQQQMGQSTAAPPVNGYPTSTGSYPDLALQAELYEQQQQHRMHMQNQEYHAPHRVPPTPNSVEIHSGRAQYYRTPTDHQQLRMYDHFRRAQKDQVNARWQSISENQTTDRFGQMTFTPLVSPAVTPLDTQFRYPDYAAPTDAFSPLTSPALRAQNYSHVAQPPVYGAIRGSDTSDTMSPIDSSLDHPVPTSTTTPATLRKSKRKTSSSSTKNPARAVRQSPAMRPSRKKQSSSTIIPAKEVSGIIEEARRCKPMRNGEGKLPPPYSQDSSGPDSVSPEPLSDILMPPPATPKSNSDGRSPYLNAKEGQPVGAAGKDADGAVATPASLMKIRKQAKKANGNNRPTSSLKEQTAAAEADMEQIMEDIVLPEPASTGKRPSLTPINTTGANAAGTLASAARKTMKNGPSSAPITASGSTFPSPAVGSMASPTAMGASKLKDPKIKTRDPKKRNSQSSVQVSPALRPKISPSIKPLLPEGGQYCSLDPTPFFQKPRL